MLTFCAVIHCLITNSSQFTCVEFYDDLTVVNYTIFIVIVDVANAYLFQTFYPLYLFHMVR